MIGNERDAHPVEVSEYLSADGSHLRSSRSTLRKGVLERYCKTDPAAESGGAGAARRNSEHGRAPGGIRNASPWDAKAAR